MHAFIFGNMCLPFIIAKWLDRCKESVEDVLLECVSLKPFFAAAFSIKLHFV